VPVAVDPTFSSNILAMTRRGWSDSWGGRAPLCRLGGLCHRHDLLVRHSWLARQPEQVDRVLPMFDHGGPASLIG
jgi:hypothetical protein